VIRSYVLLVAISSSLAVSPAVAQEVRLVTLDDALQLFATGNLELRVARSRAEQATGLARQAGAFPNPSLSATHEPLSGDAGSYVESYLIASQRFELSGSRGARSAIGERRRDVAVLYVSADSVRLAFDVKRVYLEALLAQERRTLTERIAEVFRGADRSATERYEVGDISLYALRRIRVERARYETLLADADMEVGSRQRAMALLVAPNGSDLRLGAAPLPTETPPDVPEAVLEPDAVERRAELGAARAEVEVQGAEVRLSRAERIPDLTATGGFKRQSDGMNGAFLGLSLPVPLFDRGAGGIEAADAGLRAAEEQLALTRRQLVNDVLQAIDTYEILRRRSELLTMNRDAQDPDLLDIAITAYGEGEMELVELLDAAEALHEARAAEARLRAARWIAYFDLERALGGFERSVSTEDVQ
jgi:cobalt-zinc-cadmium efflux system outer membrane protein